MRALMKIYTELAQAETARLALLDAGLPTSGVQLEAQGDEAGAMVGNFVNSDLQPVKGRGAHEHTSHHVEVGGVFILTVDVDDLALRARATSILGRESEPQ